MDRLYKKSELDFALVCIAAYVVLFSLADSLSASVGVPKLVTAPMGILLVLLVLGFIQKHGLWQRYGLCAFRGDARMSLCFLPLLLIASVNLWNGIALRASPAETVLFLLSMACAGFLEEVIFRGFLFRALCRDNVKLAVLVSSVTFGLGHIVNLLNGQALIPTLLQICYATAVGFLFTVLFYKGKSLLPCITAHAATNCLGIFAVDASSPLREGLTAALLCFVSLAYALWIIKAAKSR